MFCTQCGVKLQEEMKFCFQCGAAVTGGQAVSNLPTAPVNYTAGETDLFFAGRQSEISSTPGGDSMSRKFGVEFEVSGISNHSLDYTTGRYTSWGSRAAVDDGCLYYIGRYSVRQVGHDQGGWIDPLVLKEKRHLRCELLALELKRVDLKTGTISDTVIDFAGNGIKTALWGTSSTDFPFANYRREFDVDNGQAYFALEEPTRIVRVDLSSGQTSVHPTQHRNGIDYLSVIDGLIIYKLGQIYYRTRFGNNSPVSIFKGRGEFEALSSRSLVLKKGFEHRLVDVESGSNRAIHTAFPGLPRDASIIFIDPRTNTVYFTEKDEPHLLKSLDEHGNQTHTGTIPRFASSRESANDWGGYDSIVFDGERWIGKFNAQPILNGDTYYPATPRTKTESGSVVMVVFDANGRIKKTAAVPSLCDVAGHDYDGWGGDLSVGGDWVCSLLFSPDQNHRGYWYTGVYLGEPTAYCAISMQ